MKLLSIDYKYQSSGRKYYVSDEEAERVLSEFSEYKGRYENGSAQLTITGAEGTGIFSLDALAGICADDTGEQVIFRRAALLKEKEQ